jgi:hypothetical protein
MNKTLIMSSILLSGFVHATSNFKSQKTKIQILMPKEYLNEMTMFESRTEDETPRKEKIDLRKALTPKTAKLLQHKFGHKIQASEAFFAIKPKKGEPQAKLTESIIFKSISREDFTQSIQENIEKINNNINEIKEILKQIKELKN